MRSTLAILAVICTATVCLSVTVEPARACTTFLLGGPEQNVFAKNYDWRIGKGFLLVNPRSQVKTARIDRAGRPAEWVSRYGSVTFNQYGREFPSGGMNEVGLVVELMWLDGTEYPDPRQRPLIGTLQWIQYCLDNYRLVGDVVMSIHELGILGDAPLHFLTCDASGECATIEFLDGKPMVHAAEKLPVAVLTNDTYRESINFLNHSLGYGGKVVSTEGAGSLPRFARAVQGVNASRSLPQNQLVDRGFVVLADVAQPGTSSSPTQWSIVYDQHALEIHYQTRGNTDRRTLRLADVAFNCGAGARMIDLDAQTKGNLAEALIPYSTTKNLDVLAAALPVTPGWENTPEEVLAEIAGYPESIRCTSVLPVHKPKTPPATE